MIDVATSRTGLRLLKVFFALFVVFLYAPILLLLIFSFNSGTTPAFPLQGFTLRWYRALLADPDLIAALRTSAIVASGSSIVAVGLGLFASVVLVRRRFFAKPLISSLLLSPLVIPYVVFGISLLILFHALAVPLSILTVMVGHVVISLPYTILVLVPRLERIEESLEEAAKDLGASAWRTFRSITLPLTLPAIVAALMIAFTLSFDEYAVASFVIGREVTYPIYLFSQLRFPTRLPPVIAVAVIVIMTSFLVILATEIARRVAERRLGAEVGAPQEVPAG